MIVAGFGFRSRATVQSLQGALSAAQVGTPLKPDAAATIRDKAEAPVFLRFAADQNLRPVAIDDADLQRQQTTTQSAASLAARETGSMAEAAALAAAGPGARLIAPRVVSDDGMATCALAQGETT
nr:cobalamin biosynthesis protein [uncultured Roseobacter sp.]